MARQVIDTRLSSRELRLKLKPRDKRYWRLIGAGTFYRLSPMANRPARGASAAMSATGNTPWRELARLTIFPTLTAC